MSDLELITDNTEQALGLLIDAYKGLPRLTGLITAITNRLQEFEDIGWDVTYKRLLDYTAKDGTAAHAVGAQLDAIGRLVGRGRNGQDDATYLIYVRAQIFLNKSRALRGDVIKLLQLVESALFTYAEYYPCTVVIAFVNFPATNPLILLDLAMRAVTGGVQLFLAAPAPGFNGAGVFTCCSVGDISNPLQAFGDSVSGPGIFGGFASVYS